MKSRDDVFVGYVGIVLIGCIAASVLTEGNDNFIGGIITGHIMALGVVVYLFVGRQN